MRFDFSLLFFIEMVYCHLENVYLDKDPLVSSSTPAKLYIILANAMVSNHIVQPILAVFHLNWHERYVLYEHLIKTWWHDIDHTTWCISYGQILIVRHTLNLNYDANLLIEVTTAAAATTDHTHSGVVKIRMCIDLIESSKKINFYTSDAKEIKHFNFVCHSHCKQSHVHAKHFMQRRCLLLWRDHFNFGTKHQL